MKNFLFTLVFMFSLTTWSNYDPIINIPDANFKAKLLEASSSNQIASTQIPNSNGNVTIYHKIDTNNDGEIQLSEAQVIKWLKINYSPITSLTGIEAFGGLLYLDCFSNSLTSLNVTDLSNLLILDCSGNQLSSLNISGLINLKTLHCVYNQLISLDTQGCINLQILRCNNNQLTNLNVLHLTNLQYLSCTSNQISNLNLSGSTNLQYLFCFENQIDSLNVSGLTNLLEIYCYNNLLNNLDVFGLTNLVRLHCYANQLTNLNLSGLTNLLYLHCYANQLTTINLNGLTNLLDLRCYFNQLTTLDVSDLINLQSLGCNANALTVLFVKNGLSNINSYNFNDNPNLQYICCSDNQLTQVQQKVNQYGYTNCQVNTYCSFTPGGNFNTISGHLKYDANQNGCDANDDSISHRLIQFSVGTNTGFVSTNNQGNYNAYVGSGTHTITPQLENPTLFTISPPTAQITFPDNNNNTQTQNFCITPNGNQMDVEVIFTPLNPARPGFDAEYKIVYRNIGNQVANGELTLSYFNNLMDLVSSSVAPTTQTSEQLNWNYSNLLPFETRTINLRFNINSPTETPPVNNGDFLSFGADITPLNSDINDLNNTFSLRQEVVGSYDPNDKTCLQGNTPGPELIGQYVHYLIRFENTGTYFAENVVIRDDIDLTKFDINSLVVLDASHNMLVTRITNNNRVEFIFEGIQLPFPPSEERHGYVLFKIKTKADLTVGSTFSNQAGIYFDYNHPIITNNETSTFTVLGTPSFEFSDLIALYPNPANNVINLSAKAGINLKSIEIYNTLGQLLMALPNDSNERRIDVSHLTGGTYMIKVYTDQGQSHTKFVKK